MKNSLTRRQSLTAAPAVLGGLAGLAALRSAHAWEPGPGETIERDLTPGTTPIRLGAFLNRKENEDFPELIGRLRKEGFGGVLTTAQPVNDMTDSELRAFTGALREHDVVVFEVGGYTNMIHPDPAIRQENLKSLAVSIEAADKVNCPMVGTITGSCDPKNFFNVHPDNWTLETWNLTVDSIRQVLKDTAGMKAALGMEAQVTTNLDGPKAHRRLIDDVGDPRCAVNLDPTNMIHLHNYFHTTDLINECFDLCGEHILGSHAKDTYIWPDKQTVHVQEVCPGRGILDYETYLVRLSRLKWSRTLLPEHIPNDQFPEAKTYIRKVAAKVGVKFY